MAALEKVAGAFHETEIEITPLSGSTCEGQGSSVRVDRRRQEVLPGKGTRWFDCQKESRVTSAWTAALDTVIKTEGHYCRR